MKKNFFYRLIVAVCYIPFACGLVVLSILLFAFALFGIGVDNMVAAKVVKGINFDKSLRVPNQQSNTLQGQLTVS